jgi:hypothetical protein
MGKYFRREKLDYHAVAASASVLLPFNVIVTSHGDALQGLLGSTNNYN